MDRSSKKIKSLKIYLKNAFTNDKILNFYLEKNDLTNKKTDAIVNAANNDLWLGSGISGAIRRVGGQSIQDECDKIMSKNKGSLKTGSVAFTNKGNFDDRIKYIFHAVGPIYYDGNRQEEDLLKQSIINSLFLANVLELNSISIPPISTGIFGYPRKKASINFFECLKIYIEKFFNAEKLFDKKNKLAHIKVIKNGEKDALNEEQKNHSLYINHKYQRTKVHNSDKIMYEDINASPYININQEITSSNEFEINCSAITKDCLDEEKPKNSNTTIIRRNEKGQKEAIIKNCYIDVDTKIEFEKYTLENIHLVIIDQETYSFFDAAFEDFITNYNNEDMCIEKDIIQ